VLVIVVAAQGIILQIAMREPMWMEMNLIQMKINNLNIANHKI
jgi:hypothetical protein